MTRKLLYTAALALLTSGALSAQSAQSAYSDAFSSYEAGNFAESLRKAAEAEALLGGTNARLQSLKVLNYYENGDQKNALLQLELYFNTRPDQQSAAYSQMLSLREELKSALNRIFESSREQLEKKRQEELAAIGASYSAQKDQLAFNIAREAGSLQALEQFLRSSQTESLQQEARKLIELEQQRLNYNLLVTQGMDFLAQSKPAEAKAAFLKAAELQDGPWLVQQLDRARQLLAVQAYTQGLQDFYSGNYSKAVGNFRTAQENEASADTQQKLLLAEEELAYQQAFLQQDPGQMKAYLEKYPQGVKRDQAEAFLFHYYIRKTEASFTAGNHSEIEASLQELDAMKASAHWEVFSETYYQLLLRQAQQLTQGSRKQRQANIGLAIEHYETLDRESGERYRTRLGLLKWRQKEWSRPDMLFLAFKSDPSLNEMGFEFGSHNNNSIGFAINGQVSKQMLKNDLTEADNYGDLDHVVGMANFTLNKKILYPLWVYGGAGYANLMPVLPTGEPGMGMLDEENQVHTVNFQGGVTVHFKPVVFSLGASYPYLSEENKLKLGLEKNPLYITLGAGFGW